MQTLPDISTLNFSRVAIIGCPGSGKTTLSFTLEKILQRDVFHLDKLLWNPNWQMLEYEKRAEIHSGIIAGEQWIIDGMWKSHLADRMQRATLVIFLDYKRGLCLRRAVKRRFKYAGKQRDDIADGCLEKLDGYFLKCIWKFRKNVRPLIFSLLEKEAEHLQVVRLQNPKQTESFVRALEHFIK